MTDREVALDASLCRRRRHYADVEARGLLAHEKDICACDPVYWVNWYGYTYDPRGTPAFLPFDLFPRQAEFLRWVQERERLQEDGLVVKSRDAGVTWLCAAYALWGWLFRPGFAAGFGSRKLELVDRRGDLDSILEKVRFMLYSLPAWMLPQGFRPDEYDNLARLVNPQNEASITGEGGDNIGRGGRKTLYFLDEAAFLERPESVDRALSQNTRVRIEVSTPNGSGNPFARKRFSGRVSVMEMHWRHDPRKGDAWYAEQAQRLDPVTLAQEVDMDFAASEPDVCIPGAWVRAAVGLGLTPSAHCVAGLDVGAGGTGLTVLVARRGPVVLPPFSSRLDTWQAVHAAADRAETLGVRRLAYDAVGVGVGARAALEQSGRRVRFALAAVNGGDTPTGAVWPDGRTSREKFRNLRAELWWLLRTRFERAWEYATHGAAHRPEDMIGLPATGAEELIAQLSLPRYFLAETGKIQLEAKKQMASRGVKSPDFADALALSLAPAPPPARKAASGGQRPAWQTTGQSPDPGDRFAGAEGF